MTRLQSYFSRTVIRIKEKERVNSFCFTFIISINCKHFCLKILNIVSRQIEFYYLCKSILQKWNGKTKFNIDMEIEVEIFQFSTESFQMSDTFFTSLPSASSLYFL